MKNLDVYILLYKRNVMEILYTFKVTFVKLHLHFIDFGNYQEK